MTTLKSPPNNMFHPAIVKISIAFNMVMCGAIEAQRFPDLSHHIFLRVWGRIAPLIEELAIGRFVRDTGIIRAFPFRTRHHTLSAPKHVSDMLFLARLMQHWISYAPVNILEFLELVSRRLPQPVHVDNVNLLIECASLPRRGYAPLTYLAACPADMLRGVLLPMLNIKPTIHIHSVHPDDITVTRWVCMIGDELSTVEYSYRLNILTINGERSAKFDIIRDSLSSLSSVAVNEFGVIAIHSRGVLLVYDLVDAESVYSINTLNMPGRILIFTGDCVYFRLNTDNRYDFNYYMPVAEINIHTMSVVFRYNYAAKCGPYYLRFDNNKVEVGVRIQGVDDTIHRSMCIEYAEDNLGQCVDMRTISICNNVLYRVGRTQITSVALYSLIGG